MDHHPDDYPLCDDPRAAGAARVRVRELATSWGLPALVEPLQLIVSELVGNAIRYGRPPLSLLTRRVGRGVRVEVHDAEPSPPKAPARPSDEAESGRGMLLVDAMSTDMGVEEITDDGKRVWAEVQPPD